MPSLAEHPLLRVSVIIPTYNRAGYLREALASVFDQRLAPWEVIVVDDGSTDNTGQVIADMPAPVRFYQQVHQGVAAARNLGLQMAKGDLIAWLDSDDLWEADFLATTVSLLSQDVTVDGIYTGITMIDAEGVRLRSATHIEPADRLYEALVRGNFLATPSVVVRKACYDEVGGFDPQLHVAEDYDMWLRLTRSYRLEGIPRPLVKIRVHATNTMSNADTLRDARLMVLEKHFGAPQHSVDAISDDTRIAYGYAYRALATLYIGSGQPDRGWPYLAEAAEYYPLLLARLDTFYELALGDQPRGYRGAVGEVDIAANGDEMFRRLDGLFVLASAAVKAQRGVAYGHAYLALAMLSDQAGQWRAARCHMLRAMMAHPALVFRIAVLRRLVKLFAGQRIVKWLRGRLPSAAMQSPADGEASCVSS